VNRAEGYFHPAQDIKSRLIEDHLSLVNFLVERMVTQVPASVSREDLFSAAMMGLIDAANRYDAGRGILFKTFAEHRIRGAILDEVRRLDWFSRSLREKQSRLNRTLEQLEHRLGRSPEENEVAAEMELGIDEYRTLLTDVSHLGCISLNQSIDGLEDSPDFIDNLEDAGTPDAHENLEARELTRQLADHLAGLNEKERLVISLYYYEELTQKEIAGVLDLTEGRVSQLHSQALHKLKAKMTLHSRRSLRPAGFDEWDP